MPNHIENRLEIIGTPEEIINVKEFLKGKSSTDASNDSEIDFNNIIPMPPELNIESSTTGEYGYAYLTGCCINPYGSASDCIERFKSLDEERKAEALKLGEQYKYNRLNFGHTTWYEWCSAVWGTKWNAYHTSMESDNVIRFQTAWSNVSRLIVTLSTHFPSVKFIYEYADEDTGCNTGCGEIQNGSSTVTRLPNNSNEAYELAFKLDPDNREYYEFVDGCWKHKDDDNED